MCLSRLFEKKIKNIYIYIQRGTRSLSFLIYHSLVFILNITPSYVLLWKFAISASHFTHFFKFKFVKLFKLHYFFRFFIK